MPPFLIQDSNPTSEKSSLDKKGTQYKGRIP